MRALCIAIFPLILVVPANILASDIVRDEAGVAGLELGFCVSALGDQDGDGDGELLVGAPGSQSAGQDAGRAYLWLGGVAFQVDADRYWDGAPGEKFGYAVACVGDVNGDGIDDFAVGAPLADAEGANAGRVYLFYGGDPLPATYDLVLEGPTAGGRFGWSITPLDDLDGDGRDDFVVGAPWTNSVGIEAGAAYVFYGRSGDPHTTPDLTLEGTLAYERFGWSAAGIAEFLGGNARCLAVGAPSNGVGAGARQGAVYVFAGSTAPNPGPDSSPDMVLQSSATVTGNNEFGYSVAGIGAFDGDSDPDLAVGIPYCDQSGLDRGRVEIFYGGLDADNTADREATGSASGSLFGWSVAGVGDVVGSGLDDVLVGAPDADTPATDAGRAFLWAGGSGNVSDADNLPEVDREGLSTGTEAGDRFGAWCTWAGDLDGDGQDDYAVGAPSGNTTSDAVAGWVRFVDSSGIAVPVLIGAWSCAWDDDGVAEGHLELGGGAAAAVRRVRVVRSQPHRGTSTVIHDGAPDDGAVRILPDGLRVRDGGAGWLEPGSMQYSLELVFNDGTMANRAALSGPEGVLLHPLTSQLLASPNPFNPTTTLRWRAPMGDDVSVAVYDPRGRRVRTLFTGRATGDWQSIGWHGCDEAGLRLASGVYLVRCQTANRTLVQRVALVE